jgi:CubicO group peptidase (beta-lactamase class C family)
MAELDHVQATVAKVLDRWPSGGLAVGIVRSDSLAWFRGYGLASTTAKTPITQDTVFRIGSITKTFTAIAVMQLWERRLVDLDTPANDYLRAFRLVPVKAGLRQPTVRHLLTHTAGIGYWRRFSDLLRPGVGSGVRAGRSGTSPLALYYRRGLPVEVEPGTKWMYSNHGFATLGQIVEDVSGQPLDRYLREHIFEPMGMEHTDLTRSERVRPQLATGYSLNSRGLRPVDDREVPAVGGGAAYSTMADLARYVKVLLGGGAGGHHSVLQPETLAIMFDSHFPPDRRVPGMGLGFLRGDEGGHRTVGHDGIVSGFLSQLTIAPEDGIGVVVLGNTGALDGRGAPQPLGTALLRRLLSLPDTALRTDLLPRPETWADVCGWYGPDPGTVTNLFIRAFMGAGAEVMVDGSHLVLKPLIPIPALRRGWRLYPDAADDPKVFRVDFTELGKGTLPVVFSGGAGSEATAQRMFIDMMSFRKRPDIRNPRPWAAAALAGGAVLGLQAVAQRRARL